MITYRSDTLTVFRSALFQTTSTVVMGTECVIVVDPTWLPEEVSEIARFVHESCAGRDLYLLFTHSDYDHILGHGAFPQARTIASLGFVENPDKERCVQEALAWDSASYVRRSYAIGYPTIDIETAHDGQELTLGETRLTFTLAPGHTPDGLIALVEPQGVLIVGDHLSDIEFPFLADSRVYEETLDKVDDILGRHAVRLLVPGHGTIAMAPKDMRQRVRRSREYIHALRRNVARDDQAAIDAMLDDWPFPLGLKDAHEDNQKLIRTELGRSLKRSRDE